MQGRHSEFMAQNLVDIRDATVAQPRRGNFHANLTKVVIERQTIGSIGIEQHAIAAPKGRLPSIMLDASLPIDLPDKEQALRRRAVDLRCRSADGLRARHDRRHIKASRTAGRELANKAIGIGGAGRAFDEIPTDDIAPDGLMRSLAFPDPCGCWLVFTCCGHPLFHEIFVLQSERRRNNYLIHMNCQ